MQRALVTSIVGFAVLLTSDAPAQIRTSPDLGEQNRRQTAGQINSLGIKVRPSPHRNTTNYVVPRGGYYYYGWSPGRYYYSDGYYGGYYSNYLCPYCGSRWCRGGCRYQGPIYYPPVTVDAGTMFGPRAVRQFLGVDGSGNNAGGGANPIAVARAQAPDVPPKLSNPTVRARAWKFVEYGDRHFKNGDYHKAAERYRKAESQAPDIPDVYFRQGFAELGAGRYAEAVVAIQKGLALKPDWADSGFVLEELYPSPEAKREVFRTLHTHLDDHPNDAEAVYLLSVLQHFDGQTGAAEVGFRRVVELTGLGTHARAFLPPAPEPAQPPVPPEEPNQPLLPQ